jgi:hypothetical protein
MDAIRQAAVLDTTEKLAATRQVNAQEQVPLAEKGSLVAQAAASKQTSVSPLAGFSLVDAFASLGNRSSMHTDIVFGPDNQVAQIRVVDAVTHQVIASSPPDSIAHMQIEMQAYQEAAKNKLGST